MTAVRDKYCGLSQAICLGNTQPVIDCLEIKELVITCSFSIKSLISLKSSGNEICLLITYDN